MARVSGGGSASSRKQALPSAHELLGAMGQPYGFGPRQTSGLFNIMDTTSVKSPFQGLPVAASGADFETISLLNSSDVMNGYNPQTQAEANRRNQAGEAAFTGDLSTYYIDKDGNFVDRSKGRKVYGEDDDEIVIPGEKGPQTGSATAPAELSVVPTSTTNPARPRTVAAGYDKSRETLTVVFYDGTYYNYYEVSTAEWQAFKSRTSKGQYIYKYLDFHPRGPADEGSLPVYARTALYKIARVTQLHSSSKKGGQYDRNKTAKAKARR